MTAIALDTNLLMLLVSALGAQRVLGKRLKAFTDEDIPVLLDCIAPHDRLVVTPNVWTEFYNNWDWGVEEPLRSEMLQRSVEKVRSATELARVSRDVVDDPAFSQLGLTDCVWLAVLNQDTTLLTVDVALCNVALSRGLKAVNFTHLRSVA